MTDIDTLPADTLIDLSLQLTEAGHTGAAQIAQMKAIGREPGNARAHVALAETLLRRGAYRSGFREHEWRTRLDLPDWTSATAPWTGYSLPSGGRLLIVADQGFGDTLMFSRYLGWTRYFCDQIAFGVPPEMQTLFSASCNVFSAWADAPDHCAHVRLSSLPHLHNSHISDLPKPLDRRHLMLDAARPWFADVPGRSHRLVVGFCWHGREEDDSQRARSVPFALVRRLFDMPEIVPVCLQLGASDDELAAFPPQPRLTSDWSKTAGLMQHLDAVVTSDTAIAHMAGTLGIPTFVLLKKVPDWRYGQTGVRNPWYESHRLVRQPNAGQWEPVIEHARRCLIELAHPD